MPLPKLLIATHNPGKIREYRALLGDAPFDLVSLSDAGITEEVEETGDTFEDNALLKAQAYAAASGLLTLADDSGLEVDALDGAPGIRSARYGEDIVDKAVAKNLSDQDRVTLLLSNLDGIPWDRRTARFRCVIAVANPPTPCHSEKRSDEESKIPSRQRDKSVQAPTQTVTTPSHQDKNPASELTLLEGSVEGVIQYEPMGNNGFGYDPVFYLPFYGLTMAQLPMEEKNRISHRSQAAQKAVALLHRWHESH